MYEQAPAAGEPHVDAGTSGRYAFLEHIGSGGMADVFRARDTQLGRIVAIKLFRAEVSTPFDHVRREREIQLLGTFNHPGLVEIFDAGSFEYRGSPRRFIAMEYVEGTSLAERLQGGALTRRQVADIGAQIADALAHVHSHDVIHRDVKPDNILLSDEAALGYATLAKLADFGIAQFIDGTRFTDHNSVLGTASYISPEQTRGDVVGPPSDIYSLGLTLIESLTGEREFRGTPIESALARLNRAPEVPDDLPEEWRAVLEGMTASDPKARPTAHDVAATLRDIIRASIIDSRARHSTRRSRRADERAGRPASAEARTRPIAASTIVTGAVAAVAGTLVGILLGMHVFG